jgi:dTDP-4-amino-4,6-dideoxygalactose transaminase
MHVPFVDLTAQYAALSNQLQTAITSVLERGDFILGQDVSLFEEEFAAYCEARHAVAVSSGTAALELTLRALGIGPGHEVITAANTFIATTLAISYVGAQPVLVDVDPQTYNIDIQQVEQAITARSRAIMPVHLYGQPADMDSIVEIANRHGLVVIEDACQAHGARYKGERVGAIGRAGAFSFYPSKNLGAYGDAGLVVTNDEWLASEVRILRNYGQHQKYHHLMRGYNHRMDTLQAAVLRVKLGYLDSWLLARREHAQRYGQRLATTPVITPSEPDFAHSVYHLYVIRVEKRDELAACLRRQGIQTGIHYPIPIHLQPAYRDLGYGKGSFPVSESYAGQILSLPMYAELSDDAIDNVAAAIEEFFDEPGQNARQ